MIWHKLLDLKEGLTPVVSPIRHYFHSNCHSLYFFISLSSFKVTQAILLLRGSYSREQFSSLVKEKFDYKREYISEM